MNKSAEQAADLQAENLTVINAEIAGSLARQVDAGARIDNKSVILVGYAGAAASYLATRHAQPVLADLAYFGYGAAVCFGILAYSARLYQDVPTPRKLYYGYRERPKSATLSALAATRVEAFEQNASTYRRKGIFWLASLISLTLGATLMVLSLTSAYW